MALDPGDSLGPYEIRTELGQGGMGVVYTAHDPRLKRQVAIKVLPPNLTRDSAAKQRFLQEAKAASALDHPNICNIHEVNETDDGQLYLVMAYYNGETLKERIERGPLPVDDAVDIATQVGQGLVEAHGAGIVHRDIKPANLLITKSGVVKILDFGLAKLAGAEGVTQTGTTVGTVAYMSPEQARGEAVDHRTDIWSLGVVLYEMLSGEPPFQGENLLSLADAIRSSEPARLTGTTPAASVVVTRALNKDTTRRYQTVADLLGDLRQTTPAAAPVTSQPDAPSVAVLPFQFLAGGDEAAFLSVAFAEAVAHGLSQNEGLTVRPTSAVMRYAERGEAPLSVASDLNVQFVVEGRIQKLGSRVRVQVQAWDSTRGATVSSSKHDGHEEDLFELQDRLANSLARGFGVETTQPDAPPPTQSTRAYELFMRASERLLHYDRRDTTDAIEMLRGAVRLDERFCGAWARLANALIAMGTLFDPDPYWYDEAEQAVDQTLRLNPTHPEAWVARGRILWSPRHGFCHADALRALAKARGPGRPHEVPLWKGIILEHVGLLEEARQRLLEALEEQPDDVMALLLLGSVAGASRNYLAAQDWYERGLRLEPSNLYLGMINAVNLVYLERLSDAEQAVASARKHGGDDAWFQSTEALIWAKRGETARAERHVQKALGNMKSVSHVHHTRHYLAAALATMGEADRTIDQLREAVETGLPNYPLFLADPHLGAVRDHPSGTALLAQLKSGWQVLRREFGKQGA